MEISFHGKRALVTGAGRGIGRDLVKRLHQYGAKVVALSRTESHLLTLKEECPGIEIVAVDVGDWDATKKAVEEIGPIDLLVNNAAIGGYRMFGSITEELFDRIISINLKGPLNISQIVVKGMKERGAAGSIVNLSSVASKVAMPGVTHYGAIKAALDQMSKVMAVELGPHNIRVNIVHPTATRTDMIRGFTDNKEACEAFMERIPLKRICETAEVVDTIVYLLSDKASMVHGADIFVDGGHACT